MSHFTYIFPAAVTVCWAACIFLRKDSGKIQILLATRSKISGKSLSKWDCLIFVPSILLIPFDASQAIKKFFYVQASEEAGDTARIKEIALQSGYGNLQSFYRNFSEIMNMTPKQWLSK